MHSMTADSSRDAEHHDLLRERLLDWHAGVSDSPPWRRGAEPWHVLAAELGILRMRARDTLDAFPRPSRSPEPRPRCSRTATRWRDCVNSDSRRARRAWLTLRGRCWPTTAGRSPTARRHCWVCPASVTSSRAPCSASGLAARRCCTDNTTARVARLFGLQPEAGRHQLRVDLYRLSGTPGPDPDFNRALLDLGRTICRTGAPQCALCPLASVCTTATDPAAGDLTPLRVTRATDLQAAAARLRQRGRMSKDFTTVLPSAGRLMGSLRDIGYDLPGAIADLVDNSIDASSHSIRIDIHADGPMSWIRIADDGLGMSPRELDEAMRYGSRATYSDRRTWALRTGPRDGIVVAVPTPHGRQPPRPARPRGHPAVGPRHGRRTGLVGS